MVGDCICCLDIGFGEGFTVATAPLEPIESLGPDKDCRAVVELGLEVVVFLAAPPIEGLGALFAGAGGGAIDARPVVLILDFVLESDVLAVVAGVPVRGVEAAELAEDMAFEGDLLGDWGKG